MEKDIQKRINETMDAANYIKPASPKPFLYTRIKARMDKAPKVAMIPVPLKVACTLILILNLIFFSFSTIGKKSNASEQLASFYDINSSIY